MRVLVDTSVWSLAFRRSASVKYPAVGKLEALLEAGEDVFITGLILQEVLQAFRSDASFRSIASHLAPFPLLDLTRADAVAAEAIHRVCACRGVAASTADCQIAAAAVRHDCLLLTADRDFERIARVTDLRLA